ncbi:serine-rich adhesin for platelets-like isoform X1 [Mytilus edulis]|uniref:serine-rich adhesin for platelets-like isoform X1 n=1 Tax=Mytilus edulis TaxID=6550 RepID=UPI0039EFD88E
MSKLCVVVCGCLFLLLKGTSTLELKSYSACYGILFENFLQPSCSTGEKMAVVGLTALAKELSTSCPIQVTTPNTVPETCCQYDPIDCSIRYIGDTYRKYYKQCNGNVGCTIQVSWVNANCNQTVYLERTNYMKMDYYCISNQGLDPCSSLNTKDSRVFLWNPGFPSSPLTGSTACTCSIEASCDSTVRLTALDLRLGSSTACNQSITITDGATVLAFDCNDNNDYLPTTLYVSTSHFIQIQINSFLETPDGYYFILLEGTSPGAELTLSCASTAQSTPVVPSTSLPVCPSTDITTESTTEPQETTTGDKFSSAVLISSVKSTTVESETSTSVVRTDSSTNDVNTIVYTTGGKTITAGTGTEMEVSRASEITMTTTGGTKGTAETITELNAATTNEITRPSGMQTKGTLAMILNTTDNTNSKPTTLKTTTNTSITKPIFVSLGWTSTEKDISANVTFTTLSSVSESLQTTTSRLNEQTTHTNVTDTDNEEASPTSSKSTIIGVSIVLIVICALVMVFFLHRDKIKEKCCKKKISVETNEDVNPLYHTIFDENFNIENRAKPLQLPPLMHRLNEGRQKNFNDKELKKDKKSKETKSGLANTQIPKEQYEGSGIVADKPIKPKKKKKKKKLSQILKDSEPEYTPKPRSYGKSTFSPDIGNFLADVDVNHRFRRTSVIDITDPQGHLEKSVEINTIVNVKPQDASSNI